MKFETIYRKLRATHSGKSLMVEFARTMFEARGLEFSAKAHGEINWIWAQNQGKAAHEGKETTKGLCWRSFDAWAGCDDSP